MIDIKLLLNSFSNSERITKDDFGIFLKRIEVLSSEIRLYLYTEADSLKKELLLKISVLIEDLNRYKITNIELYSFVKGLQLELLFQINKISSIDRSSWLSETISSSTLSIPNMLNDESYLYYKWIGKQYTGFGAIVELGCWMGAVTSCLAEGLVFNGFNTKINVFDCFIWDNRFDLYHESNEFEKENLKDGDSFLYLYKKYTEKYLDRIHINQCYLYAGTEIESKSMPQLNWNNEPIEILVLDFSADRVDNEIIWNKFSPSFVPNKTIIIFNQFGNLTATELRDFIRDNDKRLKPIHKPNCSIKSFLFI